MFIFFFFLKKVDKNAIIDKVMSKLLKYHYGTLPVFWLETFLYIKYCAILQLKALESVENVRWRLLSLSVMIGSSRWDHATLWYTPVIRQ